MLKSDKNEFKIPLSDLELYATYIVKTINKNNRETLILLADLLSKINPYITYSEGEKYAINTFLFLSNLIKERLNNIKDLDLLINQALKEVDNSNIMVLDKLNRPLTINEINLIESNIHTTYENFYTILAMKEINDCWMQYSTNTDISSRKNIISKVKKNLQKVNEENRKSNIVSNSQLFSLDSDIYSQVINDVYNRACNPSTKLKTGMVAFNRSLLGGFENGRVYVYLGLPGEGKSTTLLNIGLQLKQNNEDYITKDKTKQPCILFLTMENSLDETINRIFNILISDDNMATYESPQDVKKILMKNGLAISENSPIDFIIQYVPANTVNTDYLYTIYDQLLDQGKECICLIQDYIKRIRSRDFKLLKGDIRLGLGAVIDEFKEFAIDKQIPVITASQMNREAASKVDDGRKNRTVDLVRSLGRNNIGESLLILENADATFMITPEMTKFGKKYLGVSTAKTRYKKASLTTFFQPYNNERPIELEQDINLAQPLYKTTLLEMTQSNVEKYDKTNLKSLVLPDENEIKKNIYNNSKQKIFNNKPETTPAESVTNYTIDRSNRDAIFKINSKKSAFIFVNK